MGLWQRLGQLVDVEFKAQFRQSALPEWELNQTVEHLQDQQLQLRLVIAQAIATQKRCQRHHQQAASLAEYWQYQARLALEQGDEALARQHLSCWQTYRGNSQSLEQQIQQQQILVEQLRTLNRTLEFRLGEFKIRKDILMARAQGAATIQQVQQVLSEFNPAVFEQEWLAMMANVQRLQANAQVLAEQETQLERQWPDPDSLADLRTDLGQIHRA